MDVPQSRTVPTLPNILALVANEDALIGYLLEYVIILRLMHCTCGRQHHADLNRKCYRCHSRGAEYERSIFYGTFFYKQNLSPGQILLIGYYWLTSASTSTAIMHLGHSSRTICSYYYYFRELVSGSLDEEDCMVGGEGIVVDIDECKLGKRKFNRGHQVEGVCIVGGVERTAERRLFLVPVQNRSAEVLLDIIAPHVRTGSIVNTDMWRGYSRIEELLGLEHNVVNHSRYFRDPETGTHTNFIEGTWRGVKLRIPPRKSCGKHGWPSFPIHLEEKE